ncbi:DUF4432 family protein [Sinomonas humi]|uniref:DUF4432 domain-containing protein n=1 Tax=Sinomonas humi TaxID=1338436 RepID=A0A0B2ACX0_9MICC|nr:DUF4432 family protein [Sinomonas humi]KHL01404.1 hypothetical protein LK10_16130 [Sinomonas humi]
MPERAVVSVTESRPETASVAGARLEVQLAGGLSASVLPERGLDIGDTSLAGVPISWRSPIAPDASPSAGVEKWLANFTGGLLVTCGLRNIGPASAAEPMHGDYTFLKANRTTCSTEVTADGATARISGSLDSAGVFAPTLRLRRQITFTSTITTDSIEVTDRITNLGPGDTPLALLYHLNFGAPVAVPGTTLEIHGVEAVIREDCPEVPHWDRLPEPTDNITEAVWEHRNISTDDGGVRSAAVVSPTHRVDIAWTADTLPRLYQWVMPTRRRWALGIEPSTAPLFGPDRTPPGGGAPILTADESLTTGLSVSVQRL